MVVAGQLLVTLIESYFVISAAVIFLGFGGSRWTQDFVQKYLGYAIAVGVKLMTIYLLIGASSTLFNGWAALLSSANSGLQFIINAWVVMGGAAFFAFFALAFYPVALDAAGIADAGTALPLVYLAFAIYTVGMAGVNITWNVGSMAFAPKGQGGYYPVSYTHLTLPTNREV